MAIKNKHSLWLSVLTVVLAMLVACSGWLDLSELEESAPMDHSGHVLGEAPRGDGLRRINRIGHSVGYDEERGNPAWVAYHLVGLPKYDGGDRPGFHIDDETEAYLLHHALQRSLNDAIGSAPNTLTCNLGPERLCESRQWDAKEDVSLPSGGREWRC